MAAQQPARASPELRKAPPGPRYLRNYTTSGGTTRTGPGIRHDPLSADHCVIACRAVDGTIVKVHRHGQGAKGGLKARLSGDPEVD